MDTIMSFIRTHRVRVVQVVLVLMLGVLGFGAYQALTYSLPMYQGDYRTAYDSAVADKATVLYDAALVAYQQGNYEAAKELLTEAYNQCAGSDGLVLDSKRQLGAQIKFLLGNTFVKMEKVQPAVQAYEDSLRLDPNNLYTKYNLELLQSQSGGNSGGGNQGNPGGSGSGGGKKGI